MAVIIYATVDKVLVPLLDLNPSATPYLCAVLGLITVIYTSMGGLRAVVLTAVVQTIILFGAAILTLVLITSAMGGVGAWWPSGWSTNWPEPVWGYDPGVRNSFLGALIATFTWWVCTSGSDQMAIQRYLATVVANNFWEEMTGTKGISFLWAMPLGLLVQVLVGSIASLMPVGRR